MQTPEYVGSSAARMLGALATFLVAVTVAVWFVTRPAETPDELPAGDSSPATAEDPSARKPADPFFYTAIGQSPEATGASQSKPAQQLSYTLEIKVTPSRDEAETVIDDLTAQGIEAYYTPLSRSGRLVYRIRKGVFTSQKSAAKAQVALKEQHNVATRIVKLQ